MKHRAQGFSPLVGGPQSSNGWTDAAEEDVKGEYERFAVLHKWLKVLKCVSRFGVLVCTSPASAAEEPS